MVRPLADKLIKNLFKDYGKIVENLTEFLGLFSFWKLQCTYLGAVFRKSVWRTKLNWGEKRWSSITTRQSDWWNAAKDSYRVQLFVDLVTSKCWLSLKSISILADWKVANVTTILLKGSWEEPGTCRPVSLTPVPGKLVETVTNYRIIKHIEKQSLLKGN